MLKPKDARTHCGFILIGQGSEVVLGIGPLDFCEKVGNEMKHKADFALQNVAGENLLVPLGAQVVDLNGLIMLNATARCLWELLEQDRSVEDLVGALQERFDVNIENARADVEVFLEQIAHVGLLEA